MELQDTWAVGQELKFGQMMLRRATRELVRLEKQLKDQGQDVEAIALLQNHYKELSAGIQAFANELNSYECSSDTKNWSAS